MSVHLTTFVEQLSIEIQTLKIFLYNLQEQKLCDIQILWVMLHFDKEEKIRKRQGHPGATTINFYLKCN